MRRNIRTCVQAVSETLTIQQPIVEIGAFQVEGQHDLADLRPLFADSDYTGCDLRPGPGVDRIEDVHHLSFPTDTIGTVDHLLQKDEEITRLQDKLKRLQETHAREKGEA